MTAYVSLSGVPVIAAVLSIPKAGIWHVDLVLSTAPTIAPGPQPLVFVDETWTCSVIRQVTFAGRTEARLVGGAGGWRSKVPAKQYASPGGVSLPMVLGDLASLIQESPPVLDPSLAPTVGTAFVRRGGLASNTLQRLQDMKVFTNGWWMDSTGTVQTSVRPSTPITSAFVAENVHGAGGRYIIATENPSDWAPGATFTGPTVSGVVNIVRHVLTEDSLRTEVLAA